MGRISDSSSEKALAGPTGSPPARVAHSRNTVPLESCPSCAQSLAGTARGSMVSAANGSSQAAAGLSVSSAPHGRSEQCISKATTATDKTGSIGILGHK